MLRIIELSVFVVENVGNNAIEIFNCINYRQLQMRITIVVEWYYRLNKKWLTSSILIAHYKIFLDANN